jgi:ribulose-phosphate 3-epimerase
LKSSADNVPRKVKLSASVICADLADLAAAVNELEKAGVDMLHFDIMDGHFVPNLGLGPVVLKHLRKITSIPFESHLMITNPDRYVEPFVAAGSQIVAVHVEVVPDFRPLAREIRRRGASPAIALNPDTLVERIEPFLDDVSQVLVMTVHPGFTGQRLVQHTLAKISEVKDVIRKRRLNVDVAVDGSVSFELAPRMAAAGADVLVCGTSSIFSPTTTPTEGVHRLRAELSRGDARA